MTPPPSRLRSNAEAALRWARSALRRPRVRLFLKLTVPLLVIAVVALGFQGIPLAAVGAKVLAISPFALAAVLALSFLQAASGAIRLWFVFPRDKRPSLLTVTRAFTYGQLVNTYVPGRAGDAYKVLAITRADEGEEVHGSAARRVSVADATGSLIADRGIDIASLLLLAAVFGGGALLTVLAGMASSLWVVGVGAGAALAILALLRRFWPRGFHALQRALSSTVSAMRAALSVHRLAALTGLALVGWIAELVAMMVLAAGLGFPLAIPHAVVALLVLNLGIALPVSAGNVGAFEAATAVGLAAFGVPLADGIAIGAVLHVGQIAAVVLSALAFWVRDRWVRRARAQAAPMLLSPGAPRALLLPPASRTHEERPDPGALELSAACATAAA